MLVFQKIFLFRNFCALQHNFQKYRIAGMHNVTNCCICKPECQRPWQELEKQGGYKDAEAYIKTGGLPRRGPDAAECAKGMLAGAKKAAGICMSGCETGKKGERIPQYGIRDGGIQQEQHSCTGRPGNAGTGKPVHTGRAFPACLFEKRI